MGFNKDDCLYTYGEWEEEGMNKKLDRAEFLQNRNVHLRMALEMAVKTMKHNGSLEMTGAIQMAEMALEIKDE